MEIRAETSMIDIVNKRLPLFSAVTIVLGYVNYFLYYHYFGIPIYNYLETSEIIFSFSSLIPFLLTAALTFLLISFWEYIFRKQREEQAQEFIARMEAERNKPKPAAKPEKAGWFVKLLFPMFFRMPAKFHPAAWLVIRFLLSLIIYAVMFLVFGAIVLGVTTMVTNLILPDFDDEVIFTGIFIVFGLAFKAMAPPNMNFLKSLGIYFAIVVVFILLRTVAAYNAVTEGNPKYNVTLNFQHEPALVSDSLTIYIGSTRNYHFFYDKRKKDNLVIPNAKVNSARIVSRRTGI